MVQVQKMVYDINCTPLDYSMLDLPSSLKSEPMLILRPWPVRRSPVDSSERLELRNIFKTSESSRLSSFFSAGE